MGSHIACEYALGGHEVVVLARRPDVAGERIERGFSTAREHGLATPEQVDAAGERLTITEDIAASDGARIIVESVVEDLAEKKAALLPVVAGNPEAIVASNTSSIPITAIGAAIDADQRTVGVHYWNPPLLMPMVEIIRGDETAEGVVTEMTTTLRALGKRPVLVDRDVQGFAWNRLQLALLREAVWLVENGVASPATVDEIVRDGLADWPPTCKRTPSAMAEWDRERPAAERGADPARAAGGRGRAASGGLSPLGWSRARRPHAVGAAAG